MKLVDDVGFDASFSFVYSPRPGTPAAELADDTPHEVKLARLQRLQARIEAAGAGDQRGAWSARRQRVLVEGRREARSARTRRRAPTTTASSISPAPRDLIGTLRRRHHHRGAARIRCAANCASASADRVETPSRMKSRFNAPVDNHRLANLCGALDENLRQIETALDVTIARRGERFAAARRRRTAREVAATRAAALLRPGAATRCRLDDVQLGLIEDAAPQRTARGSDPPRPPVPVLLTRRPDLHGRTPRQSRVPAAASRSTTSPSASARPAPARPTSRWPARSMRSNATR